MTTPKIPSDVVAERIADARKRQGISAPKLAELCAARGMPELNKNVLANIETRRRPSVTVDELFVIARALGISPLALLVDPHSDDGATTPVTPVEQHPAHEVRKWIAGYDPLDAVGGRGPFFDELPHEWDDPQAETKRQVAVTQLLLASVLKRMADDNGWVNVHPVVDALLRGELVQFVDGVLSDG